MDPLQSNAIQAIHDDHTLGRTEVSTQGDNQSLSNLHSLLRWNQLRDLPEGPAGLGTASFMHPEGVSPAIFFARDYPLGTAMRMGSGYFPTVLGWVLVGFAAETGAIGLIVFVGLVALLAGATNDLFIQACFNYPTLSETYKYATYDAMGQVRRAGP